MTHPLHRAIIFLTIAVLLVSCNLPAGVGLPVAVASSLSATPSPTYYQPPPDATATATPFQPLPPTPVYLPTDMPLPTETPPPTATATPTATLPPPPEVVEQPVDQPVEAPPDTSRQINILLLGSDQRPWDPFFRTDTIILATLNPDAGTVNLTSFPRDLYIPIPGYGENRINTAWGQGGFEALASTFEYNFGVRPTHYVLVNFQGFKRVIDSLGGLDVNVHKTMSDYRAGRWVTIEEGVVHMDADEVLWYVRSRKTTNDFARTRRQQEVIQALFEKLISLNAIRRVPEFFAIYKENVTMSLGLGDLLSLLPLAARITDTSRIHHYFIGPEQTYDWITGGGAMVLLPNPGGIAEVMRKALNQP